MKRQLRATARTVLDQLEDDGIVNRMTVKGLRALWKRFDDPLTNSDQAVLATLVFALMQPSSAVTRVAQSRARHLSTMRAVYESAGVKNPTKRTAEFWNVSRKTVSTAAATHPFHIPSTGNRGTLSPIARKIFRADLKQYKQAARRVNKASTRTGRK